MAAREKRVGESQQRELFARSQGAIVKPGPDSSGGSDGGRDRLDGAPGARAEGSPTEAEECGRPAATAARVDRRHYLPFAATDTVPRGGGSDSA